MENEINKGISIDEINGIKTEINVQAPLHADISKSANEAISNALGKPTKSLGNAGGIVLDFFNNTILYPMQKYNIKAKYKLDEYAKSLEEKIAETPTEKLVEPKINVIGPAFEALKYNMDEEDLKNMFTGLITKSVNRDYKDKVIPAYVEVIKQLNTNDAVFLKKLFNYMKIGKNLAIIEIRRNIDKDSYNILDKYILIDIPNSIYEKADEIILNNLERLGILSIDLTTHMSNEIYYKNMFDYAKKDYANENQDNISYQHGVLKISEFGKNFINICLS